MTQTSPSDLVQQQFGPRAASYVQSAVHARGEDLRQLAALAARVAPARALDLGCGGGHASFHVAPHAEAVVAYDLSPDMLDAVRGEAKRRSLEHIETRQGVVEALPFEDGAFDLVCTRFSAHHWTDLRAGLREARRVLRHDGHAVFMDVVSPGAPQLDTYLQSVELLRDPSHVRDYSLAEWQQALVDAGFAPAALTPRRLRLDFASWVARMATPAPHIEAIRSLQRGMPRDVQRHFEIEPDGSFSIDTMTLEARPRA